MLKLIITIAALASIYSKAFGIPTSFSDATDSNRTDPNVFEIPAEFGYLDVESRELNASDLEAINQVAAVSPFRSSSESKEYSLIVFTKVNWFAAQQICSSYGLTLASINTRSEAAQLKEYLFDLGLEKESFWTSGNNLSGQNRWFWMSNGNILTTYTNWAENEPNNAGGNENCLELVPNGEWNDANCYCSHYFICENRCPLSSYEVPLYPPFD